MVIFKKPSENTPYKYIYTHAYKYNLNIIVSNLLFITIYKVLYNPINRLKIILNIL